MAAQIAFGSALKSLYFAPFPVILFYQAMWSKIGGTMRSGR
jgi:hypothetical protein